MECQYCNKTFKSVSSLNNHKKNAKYCLIVQGKIEEEKDQIFMCGYCQKSLSNKKNLDIHVNTCSIGKKIRQQEEFKNQVQIIQEKYKINLEEKYKELVKHTC